MKKYKNFILLEDLSGNEIKEILHRDCQQFLNEGVILYRGMRLDIVDYQLFERRHDRQPTDMPFHIHKILDDLFMKKFGWKARGSGVFATSSINDAKQYTNIIPQPGRIGGFVKRDPYIFVAKGEYDILYNPDVSDLFGYICDDNTEYMDVDSWILKKYNLDFSEEVPNWEDDNGEKYKKMEQEYETDLIKFLENIVDGYHSYESQEFDIVDAASNYNEIMFNCDEYYLFNIKYKNEISKWF